MLEREDIERGGGGETSVSVGSEMEKRERDGGDIRNPVSIIAFNKFKVPIASTCAVYSGISNDTFT